MVFAARHRETVLDLSIKEQLNKAEGNDWEFVQYLSDIVAERNDYELLDEG